MKENEVIEFDDYRVNFMVLKSKKSQLQKLLVVETANSDQVSEIQLDIMSCEDKMLKIFKKIDSSKQEKMKEEMKQAKRTAIGEGLYLNTKYFIRVKNREKEEKFWGTDDYEQFEHHDCLYLEKEKETLG